MKQIYSKTISVGWPSGRRMINWRSLALCLLWLGGLSLPSYGQDCTLVCNGTIDAPNKASLGTDCTLRIDPDHILESPQSCPGDKLMTIRDLENNLLAQALNRIEFQADEYVGQTVSVTITDQATQDFCVGYLKISDTRPPFFTNCTPVTASCIQDKLKPVFDFCPPALTIDCRDDYSDLSIFGSPRVHDNCHFTLDSTFVEDLKDCGVGKILRSFSAIDDAGNVGNCLQMITVKNQHPLTEEHITWPENYSTDVCGGATDPEDLPEGFNRPTVPDTLCGTISVNYVDELFSLAPPACFKILRKWTVLDWCTFDPDYPDRSGRLSARG